VAPERNTMNTVVETTPKTSFMNYRSKHKIDDLEEEIKSLEGYVPEDEEDVEEDEQSASPQPKQASDEDEKGLSAEESTFKKRYGDLRKYQQKQKEEFEARIAELENKLQSPTAMPVSKEQVEAWVKKYPDIAGIVKSLAGEQAKQQFDEVSRRTQELEEMKEAMAYEKAVQEVEKAHPDFHTISSSDDFHKWAETQDDSIQKIIYEELKPKALISVLKLYKQEAGVKGKKPKADNSAALSVSTRSGATSPKDSEPTKWSESKVSKLSDRDFIKYEEEIMEAMRSGNFKYDMKKAR
jgi:hypothetical protein